MTHWTWSGPAAGARATMCGPSWAIGLALAVVVLLLLGVRAIGRDPEPVAVRPHTRRR